MSPQPDQGGPARAPGPPPPSGWFRRLLPGEDPFRLLLALTLVTAFFGLKSVWINPDSAGYYVYITSAVLDHDLDFTNDLDRLSVEPFYRRNNFPPGKNGRPIDMFPFGSSVLLAPFFLAGEALNRGLTFFGWSRLPPWHLDLDGLPYKTMMVGNALYCALALWLLFRTLRRMFSFEASLWTLFLCWFATPLPAYVYLLGNHSHVASALAGTVVCTLWLESGPDSGAGRWFAFGAAAGAAALIRWQDALWLLLALVPAGPAAAPGRRLTASFLGFASVFWIQMLYWMQTLGSALVPPQGQSFMRWLSPHVAETLLSARTGLLVWHPAFLLAIVGSRHLARRRARAALGVALVLAAQVYVVAATADWWGGNAFGQRRLLGVLALFALPMAAFYDGTARKSRASARVAWGLALALVAFNTLLFFQFVHQDRFFASGSYDFRRIVANQWTVLREARTWVLPFFADNLWTQLGGLAAPGRAVVLAVWAAMLGGGLAAARKVAALPDLSGSKA